ncbi:MAG: Fur family transcriptional regulator, partial [Anaerolineae bacterium]
MACEELFLHQLRQRGLRLTPQREMVLSVLHDIEGLATAEEIYAQVQTLSSSVDISTVYRTLDLLQNLHLVACVDAGDGQRRYELLGIHGPHAHLICQSCGQVIGVDLGTLQPLVEHLEREYGFATDLDHLTFPGLCQACRERGCPTTAQSPPTPSTPSPSPPTPSTGRARVGAGGGGVVSKGF